MNTLVTYKIARSTKQLCDRLLNDITTRLSPGITYHDIQHTQDVINSCMHYALVYNLSPSEFELLFLAAAGHDYGFLISPENHEVIGADMITIFMSRYGFSAEEIEKVYDMILATRIPQSPHNFLEQVIADADLDYLGRADYPSISQQLYLELKYFNKISTDQEWMHLQINFLEKHRYHTEWAQQNREPKKQERIDLLKKSARIV